MTLDEAIKHAGEVMIENLEKTKGRNASDPIAMTHFECAEEHRQLAEWLKELKMYREMIPSASEVFLAEIRNDHKCHTCKHYMSGEYDGSCDSYICEHYSGWESEG